MNTHCFELTLSTAPESVEIDHSSRELIVSGNEQEVRVALTAQVLLDEDQVKCIYDHGSGLLKISMPIVDPQPVVSHLDEKLTQLTGRQTQQSSRLPAAAAEDEITELQEQTGAVPPLLLGPLQSTESILHSDASVRQPVLEHGCAICGATSMLKCSKCRSEKYCEPAHQGQPPRHACACNHNI